MTWWSKIILTSIIIVLIYFALFHHLGTPPVKIWDESLFAMRAYFMAKTGSYLSNFNYFPGISEYRNLKPPLGTWLQGLSFRIFGYSELSLRVPVVLFALLTFLVIGQFFKKLSDSIWWGLISLLILLSCPGYIREHVTRTGDHDVLYVCFLVAQLTSFFLFVEHGSRKYLTLFTVSVLLTFMVKSIMAFFLFPAFLIYLLIERERRNLVKIKHVLIPASIVLIGIIGYYMIMDYLFPGFFQMVLETVWGRYITIRDGHQLPWYFYLQQYATNRYFPWIFLWLFFCIKKHEVTIDWVISLRRLLWICLISFLVIITISQTKLYWYDAAVYPISAMLTTTYIAPYLLNGQVSRSTKQLLFLAYLSCFAWGYYQVLSANDHPVWEHPSEQFAYQLKKLRREHPEIKTFLIYCDEYNGQVGFYAKLWNDQYGYKIDAMTYWRQKEVQKGSLIVVCHQEKLDKIRSEYEIETISSERNCHLVRLR